MGFPKKNGQPDKAMFEKIVLSFCVLVLQYDPPLIKNINISKKAVEIKIKCMRNIAGLQHNITILNISETH